MTPVEELCRMLDERGVEWNTYSVSNTEYVHWTNGDGHWCAASIGGPSSLHVNILSATPEQAIAATVGVTVCEPSKEWKAWHESLKHDNPSNVREAVENILFDAIDFGGNMGPNGNVWSGVDEGDALTEKCIDEWVRSIESVTATISERTCHCTTPDDAWCFSCSSCGKSFPRSDLHIAHNHGEINYCPNCGAKVVGE